MPTCAAAGGFQGAFRIKNWGPYQIKDWQLGMEFHGYFSGAEQAGGIASAKAAARLQAVAGEKSVWITEVKIERNGSQVRVAPFAASQTW